MCYYQHVCPSGCETSSPQSLTNKPVASNLFCVEQGGLTARRVKTRTQLQHRKRFVAKQKTKTTTTPPHVGNTDSALLQSKRQKQPPRPHMSATPQALCCKAKDKTTTTPPHVGNTASALLQSKDKNNHHAPTCRQHRKRFVAKQNNNHAPTCRQHRQGLSKRQKQKPPPSPFA